MDAIYDYLSQINWNIDMLYKVLPLIGLVFFYFQDGNFTLMLYDRLILKRVIRSKLKGKRVWICGASTGIGKQLAIRLAEFDCKLALTSSNEERLQQVKEECLKSGNLKKEDVLVCAFDIAEEEKQSETFDRILSHFGDLDILVNNAGRIYFSSFTDDSMSTDMKIFNVNTFGNVNISRIVLRYWNRMQRPGQIVVTSSLAAYINLPFMQIYSASKRALQEYYNILRLEVAKQSIDVTIVVPGPVDTQLIKNSFVSDDKKLDKARSLDFFTMTTDRCVQLMLLGIAFRLREVWICKHGILLLSFKQFVKSRMMNTTSSANKV